MGGVIGMVCIVFFCLLGNAQSYFYRENMIEPDWLVETGMGVGSMNCRTDLGGKSGTGLLAIDWNTSRLCGSLMAAATYRQTIGFRIQLLKGGIGSADSLIGSGHPGSRYDRNLHFRSTISELSVLLEFYPFTQLHGKIANGRFQLFVMAGAGWFCFNPQTWDEERWVDLQPLHTEAQGFVSPGKALQPSYRLNGLNIPVGIGFRWEAGAFMHLRLEAMHRFLFTDYLDDVSTEYPDPVLFAQFLPPAAAAMAARLSDRRKFPVPFAAGTIRGNPDQNDAFFHFQLSLSTVLNRKKL